MSPTKNGFSAGPLTERSTNTFSPANPKSTENSTLLDEKIKMPIFEHPQQRAASQGTYISPSDQIRSPTTKKLSEIKGKRYMSAKPKTLFAQTVARENLKLQQSQGNLRQH